MCIRDSKPSLPPSLPQIPEAERGQFVVSPLVLENEESVNADNDNKDAANDTGKGSFTPKIDLNGHTILKGWVHAHYKSDDS